MKIIAFFGPFLAAILAVSPAQAQSPARNVIIFVADGLRYGSVDAQNTPNMYRLKSEGVDFTNSHSLYPTVTTVNASAIATGHYIGDTGNFGNTLYLGQPMFSLHGLPLGFLEENSVLDEMNAKFGGNYINETSLLAAARAQGFQTAVIGKEGPVRIQDLTASSDGNQTIILDDATGAQGGVNLPTWFTRDLKQAFVAAATPKSGVPNIEQQVHLTKAVTRIVLPHFKESGKPFAMLFWSRDPDMSQHNTRDSLGEYTPGINGPTGKAAARNADTTLGELLAALKELGLDKTTDVFVTADHGFITVAKSSATSPSAKLNPPAISDLSQGFLATDLASALALPLRNPGSTGAAIDFSNGGKLSSGSGSLGRDPAHPDVVVAANGGSDLIYLPNPNAKALAGDIVKFLTTQDYVGAIFVRSDLGKFPGALSMRDVFLEGTAKTRIPSIYVSFRSFAQDCENPLQCTVGIHDTGLGAGQGSHGSLSRAETRNFMAAIGPSFKAGYADPAPISNADIAPTMAHIAGIVLPSKGKLKGRVITEALAGGREVSAIRDTIQSDPAENGVRTILNFQQVGEQRYFDAAGIPGRVVGLTPP